MGILNLLGKKNMKKDEVAIIGHELYPQQGFNTSTDQAKIEDAAKADEFNVHASSGADKSVIEPKKEDAQVDPPDYTDSSVSYEEPGNVEVGTGFQVVDSCIPETDPMNNLDNGTTTDIPIQGQNKNDSSKVKTDEVNELSLASSSTGLEKVDKGFEKMKGTASGDGYKNWKEIAGRYVFGQEDGTYKQTPYLSRQDDKNKYHKPDLIADIAQIEKLLFMGASLRGESHYAYEGVRQDSFSLEDYKCGEKHYVIASIADGVGNAVYSDQFSDLLVNNISIGIKAQLSKCFYLDKIDWEYISNYIWKVSLEYCKRKTGSDDPTEYYGKWASTLEFIVIDASDCDNNEFVHVTIAGDGGSYLIDKNDWYAIKNSKQIEGQYISNDVACLPSKPIKPVLKRKGRLKRGEMLFLVTDGLGDCIEESPGFRLFLGDKLKNAINLPAFISVICTSIDQMDDDKTGILIKHYEV